MYNPAVLSRKCNKSRAATFRGGESRPNCLGRAVSLHFSRLDEPRQRDRDLLSASRGNANSPDNRYAGRAYVRCCLLDLGAIPDVAECRVTSVSCTRLPVCLRSATRSLLREFRVGVPWQIAVSNIVQRDGKSLMDPR